jgi:hypothetical protein
LIFANGDESLPRFWQRRFANPYGSQVGWGAALRVFLSLSVPTILPI